MTPTAAVALPTVLQAGGLLGSPLGKLLLALLAVAVVIFLGRIVLDIAWKLVLAAAVIVGVIWLLTTVVGLGL